MSTELLTVLPDDTVQQAAKAMSQRRVSSAFVVENDTLLGIVTDRDLRVRFVAEGLPTDTPVREIMSSDIEWVDGSTTIFATTLLMTQRRFHHLPVKIDGQTRGINAGRRPCRPLRATGGGCRIWSSMRRCRRWTRPPESCSVSVGSWSRAVRLCWERRSTI
ncbi:hypothetical protein BST95_16100 [Halioglobus japonicus]|uniref:CBS domain-containing protein n=1 Tax=Halioglobus japonicus TaxID=930805 RepID=A0AAP8SPB7_9GAMM|nr:hypothetical protein BST95_16100 [Halioglobus japonicus]PLW87406.1 CBS domain-containing protein [Halioglobus japonicus]